MSQTAQKEQEQIIINKIYEAAKPDFMDRARLAEELCVSPGYVDNLVKDKKLKEEIHYFREGRLIRFYYPQIKKDFAPRLSTV